MKYWACLKNEKEKRRRLKFYVMELVKSILIIKIKLFCMDYC